MKKKTRIIGSISALALSMAMLTGGVLAASQVSLGVTSTVSFNATGVYLKAEGQVKRGTSEGSLQNLTTSANYTYTGYSYNPNTSGEPDGTPYSNTAMRDQAGSTAGWQIGEVEFTESEKVLQYAITFTNYSEFDVSITITPDVASTLTGIATSSTETQEIVVSAKNEDTPGTASYTFTMTLNNFSSSVSGAVELDISAEKYVEQLYNVTVAEGLYYFLESSDSLILSDGSPFQYSGKIGVFYDPHEIGLDFSPSNYDLDFVALNQLQMDGYVYYPSPGTYEFTAEVNDIEIDSISGNGSDYAPVNYVYIFLDIQNDSNILINMYFDTGIVIE